MDSTAQSGSTLNSRMHAEFMFARPYSLPFFYAGTQMMEQCKHHAGV